MVTVDWDGTCLPIAVVTAVVTKPPAITSCHPSCLVTTLLAADGAHTDPSLVPAHTADTLPKVSMINHIILTEALALSAIVELKNK